MDAYRELVQFYEQALAIPLPDAPPMTAGVPPPAADAPVALLFAPHPDDEVITGALPRRLQREAGARVVNVAVTLGSDPARREARRGEVAAACARLGWELEVLGWSGVTPAAAKRDPAGWAAWVREAAEIVRRHRPQWIFFPHENDWHPAHVGVNLLVTAALREVTGGAAPPWRVLTEYWQAQAEPNLLVECPPSVLAELVAALACHRGEVARQPYHRTLPAWMLDNVRRGAERLAGPGSPAPSFPFGVLYRVEPSLPPNWTPLFGAKTGGAPG